MAKWTVNPINGGDKPKDIYDSKHNTNWNAAKAGFDAHVDGVDEKHSTDHITDNSNYSLSILTDVLNLIKSTYELHVAGTADNHGSDDIDNDSTVGDGGSGDISGVFENLQAQINALVVGGIDTDPRLTQALVDFENTDWTVAGFKALQDFWQERITIIETQINTKDTLDVEVNDSVSSLPAGAVDGPVTDLSMEGLTLDNDVKIGNITTVATSDNSGTFLDINTDGTWVFFNAYDPTKQTFNIKANDKVFLYTKLKESSVGRIKLQRILHSGGTITDGVAVDDSLELGDIVTVSSTGFHNFKIMESTSGLIERDYQILINMTALSIDQILTNSGFLTIEQQRQAMIDLVSSGYFEDIKSVTNPKVEIKNFDETESQFVKINVTLKHLPNLIRDKILTDNNSIFEEKNINESILDSADIDSYLTSKTSYDAVRVKFPIDSNVFQNLGSIKVSGFGDSFGTTPQWTNDSTDDIGRVFVGISSAGYYLTVPKGTYADLAAAQSDLSGTFVQYELAIPEPINITERGLVDGELHSFENGTVYNTSDTFHSPLVNFTVPANIGAQTSALIKSSKYQQNQIDAKAYKVQEESIVPTATGGWSFTDVSYYKDEFGETVIQGFVTGGAGSAFTLITGYEPLAIRKFRQADTTTGGISVTIGTDGTVTPSGNGYLDGIRFKAVE